MLGVLEARLLPTHSVSYARGNETGTGQRVTQHPVETDFFLSAVVRKRGRIGISIAAAGCEKVPTKHLVITRKFATTKARNKAAVGSCRCQPLRKTIKRDLIWATAHTRPGTAHMGVWILHCINQLKARQLQRVQQ